VFVDLRDLVGAFAGGPNEIRPFDGRLDIDEFSDDEI